MEIFAKRGEEIIENNIKAATAGYDFTQENYKDSCLSPLKSVKSDKKVFISGNEALSLGAMAARLQIYVCLSYDPFYRDHNLPRRKGRAVWPAC